MRLSVKAMAVAGGIVVGGYALGATAIMNLIFPPYGEHFLTTMTSVYPGYHATRSIGDLLVGVCYGVTDGAVAGALLAWAYNYFAG